jgi:hypothetical protein
MKKIYHVSFIAIVVLIMTAPFIIADDSGFKGFP